MEGGDMPLATADGMKICSKCNRALSVDQFYKNRAQRDGLDNRCRDCEAQRRKDTAERKREVSRLWRANNPEKYQAILERDKKSYRDDPEVRKRKADYDAYYRTTDAYQRRLEDKREKAKEKYHNDPEWRANYDQAQRKWNQNNRDKANATNRRRRVRKADLPVKPYSIAEIVDRDGTICALTGKSISLDDRSTWEVDHLIPIQVDMGFYNSIEPHAPHPGDQLGSVRIVDAGANSGRSNRMTVLDHVELQCRMPCWFTRAAIEQHYSNRS